MSLFKEIQPTQLNGNPFLQIGQEWMLITAEKEGKVNTMTASWGGFGVMFGKNVAFIVIRPHRYTKGFVDHAQTFSLTFFDSSFKKELGYLGSVSGRDEDKISVAGLSLAYEGDTPYFSQARRVLLCEKLYAQPYTASGFLDQGLVKQVYPGDDFHTLYIGEIKKVLVRE